MLIFIFYVAIPLRQYYNV